MRLRGGGALRLLLVDGRVEVRVEVEVVMEREGGDRRCPATRRPRVDRHEVG